MIYSFILILVVGIKLDRYAMGKETRVDFTHSIDGLFCGSLN